MRQNSVVNDLLRPESPWVLLDIPIQLQDLSAVESEVGEEKGKDRSWYRTQGNRKREGSGGRKMQGGASPRISSLSSVSCFGWPWDHHAPTSLPLSPGTLPISTPPSLSLSPGVLLLFKGSRSVDFASTHGELQSLLPTQKRD